MGENRYNYLFDLLTGTSPYTNNAGISSWARAQLLDEYQVSKEAEYIALLAMGFLPANGAGNKSTKNTKVLWDIKTGADKKITYKFKGDTVTAYRDPKTGLWWAKDTTGHADSAYKVFKEAKGGKELHWVADSDKYGNFIDGKHKSSTGTVIKIK
ncbi:hypothetical protein [Paenibacillus sp. JZ16]|nr:hypothetical protein [Paenibacillus sp. JZ16]